MMRLKQPSELTPEEKFIAGQPEKRQLVSYEINADEASQFLKDLPWAQVIITPTRLFFRY